MIRQKLLMMFALVLSVSLFAAACGGSDSDTEEASDSDTTTTTEAEDEPEAEAEAEEPEAEEDTDDQQAVDTTLDEEELEELGSDDVEESAVASGDPVPGGTLVLGSTQVPRHLNGVVQSGYATAVPGTQLNASPLLFDDEFNPQPYLAESWEVAEDGLSVTLNLGLSAPVNK